jgi:hypothetical protein
MPYDRVERVALLQLARTAIATGLSGGPTPAVDASRYSAPLQATRASFVTLEIETRLRGCIGSLSAHRPLALDVACNAHAAAFADPRFDPLAREEFDGLSIHISVLSPREPLPVRDETDLCATLRRGIDGLILAEGEHRATFLPAVWSTLPRALDFVRQLKRKAGLPPEYWSPTLRFERYETEVIE